MWGVPKRRRSVERRLTRRFGLKEWHWKMLIPKYNLLICDNCGHHYQAKHMCSKSKFFTFSSHINTSYNIKSPYLFNHLFSGNCYEKNLEETKVIRESIEAKLGHSPIDKDVIVLYQSDREKGLDIDESTASLNNKLLVEIPKDRPSFFSPNLLQKSTAGLNKKSKDVTTTDPVLIVHKTESN